MEISFGNWMRSGDCTALCNHKKSNCWPRCFEIGREIDHPGFRKLIMIDRKPLIAMLCMNLSLFFKNAAGSISSDQKGLTRTTDILEVSCLSLEREEDCGTDLLADRLIVEEDAAALSIRSLIFPRFFPNDSSSERSNLSLVDVNKQILGHGKKSSLHLEHSPST